VPGVSWERFQSTVDLDDLWNPSNGCHDDWVISLVTAVINSGAVRDELLQLLGPVCKIKVGFVDGLSSFKAIYFWIWLYFKNTYCYIMKNIVICFTTDCPFME